jgi:putative ABC transport system permease protein
MLSNYLKVAFRNILRNKLFASINVLGLAVGMSCFILISLWIQDELSYDRFHKNREDLYMVTIKHPNGIIDPNVPYALTPLLASEYPEIVDSTRIVRIGNIMTCSFLYRPENGQPILFYEDRVNLVDPGFFSMFSFPFIYGSPETALKDKNALVISEVAAKKYFGEDDPIGKQLTFNNEMILTVSGVVRVPSQSHLQFDFVSRMEENMVDNWNWRDPSYVLLRKNSSVDALREKIGGSLIRHFPHPLPGDNFTVGLMPVSKVHLDFGRRTYIYVFSVIAVFILLIALINYTNLATARSSHRAKEVGVRKVVGAQRNQLIRQFLTESVLMSLFASILALILTGIFLPLLNNLTSKQLVLLSPQNVVLYLFVPCLAVGAGILSGIYPSLFLASCQPAKTIRAYLSFRTDRSPFRVVSVVGQFTIAVLLIACTGLVFKQLRYIQKRPLGFQTDQVIKIPLNDSFRRRFMSLKNELLQNPNVLFVTASQAVPYDEDYKTSGIEWERKNPSMVPNIRYSITQFDYLETFGMEIVEGRSFSREFPSDRNNFVINEQAVKYMDLEQPIGARLEFWGREGQVIGVVKDFHHVSLHKEIKPHVFSINPAHYGALKYVMIKLKPDAVPDTVRFIKEVSEKFAPSYPFVYSFLDKGVGDLYEAEQRLIKIFGYFAFIAIFISCLGIFGLSAFTAEQRTKEIGVRKVLGATSSGLVVLLSKEFIRWVLLANAVSWPVAYLVMKKWLQNFAYRTDVGLDIFLLAGVLSLLIALLSVSYQSIRAALSDPIESLKYE